MAYKNQRQNYSYFVIRPYYADYHLHENFMLVKSANSGDPIAQHELGLRYLTGEGFPADTVKSAYWIGKAAAQDLPAARYNYGILLNNGWGVKWNPFEAYKNFLFAAQSNMPQAQYVIGLLMTENLIVPRDLHSAYAWIKKSSESGFEPAKEVLKELESRGISNTDDLTKRAHTTSNADTISMPRKTSSVTLEYIDFTADTVFRFNDSTLIADALREASEKLRILFSTPDSIQISKDEIIEVLISKADYGNPEAMTLLGRLYEKGALVNKDPIAAAAYYIRAYRLDSFRASRLLWEMVKEKNFFELLRQSVSKGRIEAMFVWAGLTALHFDNQLTEADALNLLTASAQRNHVPSLVELGLCYYLGNLVKQDKAAALYYWKRASDLNSVDGEIRIIVNDILENKPNLGRAVEFLKQAEGNGSLLAQVALGLCYEKGAAVELNKLEAVRLYRKAAFRGNRLAYSSLRRIYDELRPTGTEFFLN